jgi:four helix bundle protein
MTKDGSKEQELANRLLQFAVLAVRLAAELPKSEIGNLVRNQLLKCGTSPGANYEEARGAESRSDFIHKMGIVLKELKESRYWLRVIKEVPLLETDQANLVSKECEELIAIIAKSIFTAKRNRNNCS